MIKANEEKIIMSGHEGGWPFPDRIGVPLNPERDGWHWISSWVHSPGWKERMPWCVKWIAERKVWAEVEVDELGSMADWTPARIASEFNYIAPCFTPSEISIIKKEQREAGYHAGYEDGCKVDAISASVLYQSAVDEGRITEREKIASQVDCGCDIRDAVLDRLDEQGERKASWLCSRGDSCSALVAAIIRNDGREKRDE